MIDFEWTRKCPPPVLTKLYLLNPLDIIKMSWKSNFYTEISNSFYLSLNFFRSSKFSHYTVWIFLLFCLLKVDMFFLLIGSVQDSWDRTKRGNTLEWWNSHLGDVVVADNSVWVWTRNGGVTVATSFMYCLHFFRRRACTKITSTFKAVTSQIAEHKGVRAINKYNTTHTNLAKHYKDDVQYMKIKI